MKAEELGCVFCAEAIKQELDHTSPFFQIPETIRNFYKMSRPFPLIRAYYLEEKLQTPALGSGFIPVPNHADGLWYHGMSFTLSELYHQGLMEAAAVSQSSVFEAAEQWRF